MYKPILICLLLTGCIELPDVDYVCIDGWQWDIVGNAIVDEKGNQLNCESVPTKPEYK